MVGKVLSAFCLLLLAGPLAAAPDLQVLDLEGNTIRPFAQRHFCAVCSKKAIVFVFVSNACPIANRYAPEIQRLHKKYSDEGLVFWLVYADPDETSDQIGQHMRDYGYKCGVLRDPKHELVKLAGVHVTPEAALFLPEGKLVYRGRINNRYEDFGKQRARPTKHELQDAIEAVLAGKPVRISETKAVGCYIAGLQ
jgi:hypothetical protein